MYSSRCVVHIVYTLCTVQCTEDGVYTGSKQSACATSLDKNALTRSMLHGLNSFLRGPYFLTFFIQEGHHVESVAMIYSREGCFVKGAGEKAKPIIANPLANI
jgi:hypothetical protein